MQVLVAALFLAVIGGSVGLAVGLRDRDRDDTTRTQGSGGTSQATQEEQVPATLPSDTVTGSPSAGAATVCQEQARRDDLTEVLYLETQQSEVRICQDGGGLLYYVGHRLSDETWLVLNDVERRAEEYVATNDSSDPPTVYRVSAARLVINYPDGRSETQGAVFGGR